MILMTELPRDLEARFAAAAARRSISSQDLLRAVLDDISRDAPGQTTLAALPFYVSSTPDNWEQAVRDWATSHGV